MSGASASLQLMPVLMARQDDQRHHHHHHQHFHRSHQRHNLKDILKGKRSRDEEGFRSQTINHHQHQNLSSCINHHYHSSHHHPHHHKQHHQHHDWQESVREGRGEWKAQCIQGRFKIFNLDHHDRLTMTMSMTSQRLPNFDVKAVLQFWEINGQFEMNIPWIPQVISVLNTYLTAI